jgi:hypothetical protein
MAGEGFSVAPEDLSAAADQIAPLSSAFPERQSAVAGSVSNADAANQLATSEALRGLAQAHGDALDRLETWLTDHARNLRASAAAYEAADQRGKEALDNAMRKLFGQGR